ncbi:MAG: hypothetical protein PSX80_13690, partial [bacterium]|nr:hypothetical protein [bacterium]
MKRSALLLIAILVVSLASYGQATELEGEWVSMSEQTRGITRIVITLETDGHAVEAWGKCHPTDCAWGRTPLTRVGKSVEDRSFTSGYAIWEPGFASKYVLLSLDRRMLRVETVNVFRDRSSRSSYRIVEYLRRPEETID